jgi:hypothetical protein
VPQPLLELNDSINEREECVITACAYIVTGVIGAATLPYKDISRANNLTTKFLHAKALPLTVSTVPGTSYRFLMCHDITLDFQNHD